jgi:hypothetical protein
VAQRYPRVPAASTRISNHTACVRLLRPLWGGTLSPALGWPTLSPSFGEGWGDSRPKSAIVQSAQSGLISCLDLIPQAIGRPNRAALSFCVTCNGTGAQSAQGTTRAAQPATRFEARSSGRYRWRGARGRSMQRQRSALCPPPPSRTPMGPWGSLQPASG